MASALFAVGWGANQFPPLLLLYRQDLGVGPAASDALWAVYAVALIPALLIGGQLSDRLGRSMVVPCTALSLLATVVLICAPWAGLWALVPARLLAGAASGLVFAPATAWVKELSTAAWDDGATEQSGARRAAIAMTSGFAGGPLVSGALAQFVPAPLVTACLPHLLVVTAALALVRGRPDTGVRAAAGKAPLRASLRIPSARSARFVLVVVPMAPWVFTTPSVAGVVLPAALGARIAGAELVYAGILISLTLVAGVLAQPAARRLSMAGPGRAATTGLVATATGLLLSAAALRAHAGIAVPAAAVLGTGYGMCLVAGLLQTQRAAPADQQARLTGVYYAATYLGFFSPLLLRAGRIVAPTPVLLVLLAAVACVTAAAVAVNDRRLTARGA